MVSITGYFLRALDNGRRDLIDCMLQECATPYVENEIVKIPFTHNKVLGIVVPKNRALYDYVYDLTEQRGAVIYGYVVVNGKRVPAREIMLMSEDEFYRLLEKADGSFLAVKVDNEKVWVATDWLGTRPVYYAVLDYGIVFSSCLWSILRFLKEMNHPIRLNDKAILSYIWLGRIGVIDDLTFIEDVHVAPPGSSLTYDLRTGKLYVHRYYKPHYESKISEEKEAIELVHNALLVSIKEAIHALPKEYRRNICVFLSGGLDSRVLAHYLSRLLDGRILALTFGTEKSDEIPIAKKVAEKLGIPHVVGIYELNQLADYVRDLVLLSDGFDVVSASHVVYAMKMLVENDCHIFTDGFALDLTLGGSYLHNHLRKIRNKNEFLSHIYRKISVFDHKELISIIGPRLRSQLLKVLQELKSLIEQSTGDSYMNRSDYFFLYTRVRRFTIYGSIVERCSSDEILPTISRKFAEVFTRIDPNLRINHKIYRKFLLSLNKRLALIPYKSTWIPPLLPIALWKIGFVIQRINNLIRRLTNNRMGLETTYFDFNEALRQKNWRKLLYETLLDRESLVYKLGYLDYNPVKAIVIEHLRRKRNDGEKIAYLSTLELVLREIFKSTFKEFK